MSEREPGGRVDAHHHVWDLAVREQPWLKGPEYAPIRRDFGLAELAPAAAAAGVNRTVVVQTVGVAAETPELLALADRSGLVAGVVGWIDLTDADADSVLAGLRNRPDGHWLKGIRHQVHDEPDPDWLGRADVRWGLAAVARAGLTYDLLTRTEHLPAAEAAVRAMPELTFVLDHLSKPVIGGSLEPWADGIRRLAAYPNVSCKLSGLVTEASWTDWTTADLQPYADLALTAFGPDRILFGSDWPVCLLAASYADVTRTAEQLTTGLTPTEHDQIFGGTATQVYRL